MIILIVGDSCEDVFIYGDITRLTPEAPAPVFNPLRKKNKWWYGKKCRK